MEELVNKARAGDKEAFAQVIRICESSLFRTAWAILRNNADADDAMQEAIIRCWKNLDDLREAARFKTWATRILINECRKIARNQARTMPTDSIPETATAEKGYTRTEWQMLLACLPERSRTVVILHYVEGYKVAEVASILNANENTVKTWLATARSQYESMISR